MSTAPSEAKPKAEAASIAQPASLLLEDVDFLLRDPGILSWGKQNRVQTATAVPVSAVPQRHHTPL